MHWLFRLGMLLEFAGHGAAGISLKEGWVRYFAVFGFDKPMIHTLMPIVGTIDISLGVLGFVSPRRWALVWCAFWGLMTASLRPIAGESFWEVLDRAGNYGGPLAFLILSGWPRTVGEWTAPIRWRPAARATLERLAVILKWVTALTLIGHGAYGALLQKRDLLDQYSRAGLTALPLVGSRFTPALGWIEMTLGVAIAIRPLRYLALAACVFKVVTELLYPVTGYPLYEFVERGFSYVAVRALPSAPIRDAPTGEDRPMSFRYQAIAKVAWAVLAAQVAAAPAPTRVVPAVPNAAVDSIPHRADSTLVGELSRGGFILFFRHAMTNWNERDATEGGNLANRAGQRNLSEEGQRESAGIGVAIKALEIPIERVLASPMWRCRDTAQFAFGAYDTTGLLFWKSPTFREARITMLSTPPAAGKNLVLVGHQDQLIPIIPGLRRDQLKEGDALVIQPMGKGKYRVVTQITPADWARLAGVAPPPTIESAPADSTPGIPDSSKARTKPETRRPKPRLMRGAEPFGPAPLFIQPRMSAPG
ncbi:MAG TPA: histidine phosphatase family protein [Candidatus Eisenbacteria bacterium]|nr:histidine phosphatase family protein [Candidatus Eisenbacteria bacterium]